MVLMAPNIFEEKLAKDKQVGGTDFSARVFGLVQTTFPPSTCQFLDAFPLMGLAYLAASFDPNELQVDQTTAFRSGVQG